MFALVPCPCLQPHPVLQAAGPVGLHRQEANRHPSAHLPRPALLFLPSAGPAVRCAVSVHTSSVASRAGCGRKAALCCHLRLAARQPSSKCRLHLPTGWRRTPDGCVLDTWLRPDACILPPPWPVMVPLLVSCGCWSCAKRHLQPLLRSALPLRLFASACVLHTHMPMASLLPTRLPTYLATRRAAGSGRARSWL